MWDVYVNGTLFATVQWLKQAHFLRSRLTRKGIVAIRRKVANG